MTKKIEEMLNLEPKQAFEAEEPVKKEKPVHKQVNSADASYQAVQEIAGNLPQIQELDNLEDVELESLAEKAEQAYDDLMDLGMNVEVRYSGRIFEVASSMMKNAIDARVAKVDKRLKAVDLQLKKLKIDNDRKGDDGDVLNGQGFVITDRNELLKKLGQKD